MDSAKCSHRRRPRPIEHGLILFALAGSAWCQPSEPAADDGLAVLDKFLADVQSLSADFRQEQFAADERLLETATGKVSLKRPNRFLWRYVEPIEQSVVADGTQLWMYDVELAQVTVAPLTGGETFSPAMLLSGDRTVQDGFEVTGSDKRDGLQWVELTPKQGAGDFTAVAIGFEAATPRRLELVDGLNQKTRIELTNVVVNPDLPDSMFEFEPPPGVDVLGGD